MVSTADALPPLIDPSFVQIGSSIWLRNFPADPASVEDNQPAVITSSQLTIVILFWMDAQLRYANKYISEYVKLAPNARIVFVLTSSSDLFLNASETRQIKRVQPAVDVLLSSSGISTGFPPDEQLYFHIFSNGGCVTLRSMALAYRNATQQPLPVKSLVMDSCPGKPSFSGAFRAISYGFPKPFLPRLFAKIFVWLGLLLGFAYCRLFRLQLPTLRAWEALTDPGLISGSVKRCYVYSELDDLISWKDVEEHSAEAAARKYQVSMEKFDGSAHVGHMRLNPQRYWSIVARYLRLAME